MACSMSLSDLDFPSFSMLPKCASFVCCAGCWELRLPGVPVNVLSRGFLLDLGTCWVVEKFALCPSGLLEFDESH